MSAQRSGWDSASCAIVQIPNKQTNVLELNCIYFGLAALSSAKYGLKGQVRDRVSKIGSPLLLEATSIPAQRQHAGVIL